MSDWAKNTMRAMRATAIPAGRRGPWRVEQGTLTALLNGEEPVMTDDDTELRTHLEFVRNAHGRVLVTGLGLGCVLRGIAANGQADSITVVERDQDVISLVWPYVGVDARLVHDDAFEFAKSGERFDCAWHDLWKDPTRDVEELVDAHVRLVETWRDNVGWQGVWKAA